MDPQSGAAQTDPLIGQTVGNYLVTQKLGEGGMGAVYLAEHPTIGKKVALKVLHSEFLDLGRLRVHHTYGGHGSPVVFIHGLGSSGYMEWRLNLEEFVSRHRVFAPDLPGFGRTDKPRVRYTIPYFARFIRRYMEDRRIRSAVLVGASLGGRVALEVALESPGLV